MCEGRRGVISARALVHVRDIPRVAIWRDSGDSSYVRRWEIDIAEWLDRATIPSFYTQSFLPTAPNRLVAFTHERSLAQGRPAMPLKRNARQGTATCCCLRAVGDCQVCC